MQYQPWMDFITPDDIPNDDLKNVEVLAKYETALALMLYCPGMTISVPTMRFSKAKRRYIERQYDGRKFTLNRLAVECGYTQRYVYKILQLLREDKKSNSTLPKWYSSISNVRNIGFFLH